jgi:hypothetical protein
MVNHHGHKPDEPADQYSVPEPAVKIPAALRPINLDDEVETELPSGIVPPRRFSLTAPADDQIEAQDTGKGEADSAERDHQPETSQPQTLLGIQETAATDCPDEAEEMRDEDRELEEGYSSLLSLSKSDRQQFVRIEDADIYNGETKPFVVFPHEEAATPGPFARPDADFSLEGTAQLKTHGGLAPASETEERLFDRPDSEKGSDKGGAKPADRGGDPEETERSLRAALATLQRMSGAA